jgi:hypothetical protein
MKRVSEGGRIRDSDDLCLLLQLPRTWEEEEEQQRREGDGEEADVRTRYCDIAYMLM